VPRAELAAARARLPLHPDLVALRLHTVRTDANVSAAGPLPPHPCGSIDVDEGTKPWPGFEQTTSPLVTRAHDDAVTTARVRPVRTSAEIEEAEAVLPRTRARCTSCWDSLSGPDDVWLPLTHDFARLQIRNFTIVFLRDKILLRFSLHICHGVHPVWSN
jgi:hypothetical protein